MLQKPISEMSEEEIIIQIENIRQRRLAIHQSRISGLRSSEHAKEKVVKADVVTGELSDILGKLLEDVL